MSREGDKQAGPAVVPSERDYVAANMRWLAIMRKERLHRVRF